MARKQKSMMAPEVREELEEFVARQIAPRKMNHVKSILRGYSDTDLMGTITAANLHYQRDNDANSVAGYVTGNDLYTIRLLAEHARTIRLCEVRISDFYYIQRALERLGIMGTDVDSFPDLGKHLEISSSAYYGSIPYASNDALILFVQENVHRHEEIVDYMMEHKISEVSVLRAHFNGEAPALGEGII